MLKVFTHRLETSSEVDQDNKSSGLVVLSHILGNNAVDEAV